MAFRLVGESFERWKRGALRPPTWARPPVLAPVTGPLAETVRRLRIASIPLRLSDVPPSWRWTFAFVGMISVLVWHEARTSALQARLLSTFASKLSYDVAPGPSDLIVFPQAGPYDLRQGYARIPEFARRLAAKGFRPVEQARFSKSLATLARLGITPPYREPSGAGLVIRGFDGDTLYDLTRHAERFERYEDVPPLVVSSLLYMENRELRDPTDPRSNPVVDWARLGKASLMYAGHKLGLPVRVEGGSTLAIQLEKYRHSDEGRTDSPLDKLQQMLAASLRVYRDGPDTRQARREIVVDYLNTMPLAAAPGRGEVQGLLDGLEVWFDLDPAAVRRALQQPEPTPAKASAFKHVLALLYAVRAPSRYLLTDRDELEERVSNYITVLEQGGVVDPVFAEAVRGSKLAFADGTEAPSGSPFHERKPLNLIRTQLTNDLGVRDFYDLDRLHLDVESTLDPQLQAKALELFEQLRDSAFVAAHGLRGERLLSRGDPSDVVYSLTLYERGAGANLLRVHVDNLDRPFDLNRSMKMELGSTAKLRTLTHYLQIVAEMHGEMASLSRDSLAKREAGAKDELTRWAAATLRESHGLALEPFLQKALDREYSASPGEVFFTGGGIHTFGNFDPQDNHRRLSVREATARSTNLVYIRLMRDLIRWHAARLPYDAGSVLANADDPDRAKLVGEAADDEARQILTRAWRSYRGLDADTITARLLDRRGATRRNLAVAFLAWNPGATADSLFGWLGARVDSVSWEETVKLHTTYSPMSLLDLAYVLHRHPLEVWCAGQLARDRDLKRSELLARSDEARKLASSWLSGDSHRRAQDVRLRIRIEQDAVARMTPYWKKLGFPFDRLVPSYATAIGSSSDRPDALADLMGILVNDGMRLPDQSLSRLRFGAETPYHTVVEAEPAAGERVLPVAVARAVRGVLRDVVEKGTARRMSGAFITSRGDTIPVGGKTGSGDNRFDTFSRGGGLISSRAVNRTAAFVFYVGDRYYGVLTASVEGPESGDYVFTSSLPLAVLRLLSPALLTRLDPKPEPDSSLARGSAGTRAYPASLVVPAPRRFDFSS